MPSVSGNNKASKRLEMKSGEAIPMSIWISDHLNQSGHWISHAEHQTFLWWIVETTTLGGFDILYANMQRAARTQLELRDC